MATLAIAGCDRVVADKGVLASVGSEQITQAQLDAELKAGGMPQAANPNVRRAALEQVITRKLLARAARAENLDSTAEGRAMKAAAMESVEAGLALGAIQAKVKTPTPAEAEAYVRAHPERFAERSGYLVDQLHARAPIDAALMDALRPTKTLEEVERVLQGRGIPFRRGAARLDTLRADPRLSTAIRKVPPGEPFVLSEPGGFSVSVVRQSAVRPVVGAQATAVATEFLLAERRGKAITERIVALRKDLLKYAEAAPSK